jgi:hypothetical protein
VVILIYFVSKNFQDMEQYRIRPKRKFKSLLTGDDSGDHHFIPYPNDPPHTFPSIKARAFVKIFF